MHLKIIEILCIKAFAEIETFCDTYKIDNHDRHAIYHYFGILEDYISRGEVPNSNYLECENHKGFEISPCTKEILSKQFINLQKKSSQIESIEIEFQRMQSLILPSFKMLTDSSFFLKISPLEKNETVLLGKIMIFISIDHANILKTSYIEKNGYRLKQKRHDIDIDTYQVLTFENKNNPALTIQVKTKM